MHEPAEADSNRAALEELFVETKAIGETLKSLCDQNPSGSPSPTAARVFEGWLAAATPYSFRQEHFADVAANYDVLSNTNKDLWDLFSLLENYIEFPEPEEVERVFIGLPLLPANDERR